MPAGRRSREPSAADRALFEAAVGDVERFASEGEAPAERTEAPPPMPAPVPSRPPSPLEPAAPRRATREAAASGPAMACSAPGPMEVTSAQGSPYAQRNAVPACAIATSFRNCQQRTSPRFS